MNKGEVGDLVPSGHAGYITAMKILAAMLALMLMVHGALACANLSGSGTTLLGTQTGIVRPAVSEMIHFLALNPHEDGVRLELSLRGSTNFNDRSDYAVALMYLGRSTEAVARLQELEAEKPGEYVIAANLGTALELSGDNAKALHWIKEGVRRNPDSHKGTEWLHVRILEAKIAAQAQPDYFTKHSVLELQAEQIGETVVVGGEEMSRRDLSEAIRYQLKERLQFVKPPDAPVASLLFDYAAIEAATRTLESAKGLLKLAQDYGYPAANIERLNQIYDQRIAWRKIRQYTRNTLIGLAIGTMLVLLLRSLYKRGIFVLSSKDLKRA